MFPKSIVRSGKTTTSASANACGSSGCLHSTREGKPYCPDHVKEHPYVQGILSTLQDVHAEREKVRERGARAVDLKGLTTKELLLHLTLNGARTIERLARELQLDSVVLNGYVRALVKQGVVDLGRTNRGSTVVKLAGRE